MTATISVVLRGRYPLFDDLHRLNRKLLLMRLRESTRLLMRAYRVVL